jgi:hypothetical protein
MFPKSYLIKLKWIILIGGSLFFFIRAIYMASTGGDYFGTINPVFSWFLLSSEISFSGTTVIIGISGFIMYLKKNRTLEVLEKFNIPKIVIFTGITSYSIHFIRVALWIFFCVI